MEDQDRDRVAALFKGIAHPTRIAIMYGIRDEESMVAVADQAGVSRGTVQDHAEMLRDAHLIYRPSEEGRRYGLTPLGEFILELLDESGEELAEAVERVEDEEASVGERYADISDLPLDERDVERAVHTEAWESVWTKIADMLDSD